MEDSNIHISCLVDDQPHFRLQAWNWLLSLKFTKSVAKPFVHFTTGALGATVQEHFESLGATLIEVEPFGDGSARYCNKILQLESESFIEADFVILSDADLLFLADPATLLVQDKFRAKQVDLPNPTTAIWRILVEKAGLTDKVRETALEFAPKELTFETNFNGGLYLIPRSMIEPIAKRWRDYSTKCLEQGDLMGIYAHHADQVGMGLALIDLNAAIEPLSISANFPTHLPADLISGVKFQNILAVHYHNHVDQHGLPNNVGVEWIDSQLAV